MVRYIALLRGINVGGKNKIAMADLKQGVVALGYSDAVTHLNSGNVVFSSERTDTIELARQIERMIEEKFALTIPVHVILQTELKTVLDQAPDWWGTSDKEIYDNLIFMLPSLDYEEFYREIGAPKPELEQVFNYQDVIFWSFERANFKKTNWWSKTATKKVKDRITIRTANTVRKLVLL